MTTQILQEKLDKKADQIASNKIYVLFDRINKEIKEIIGEDVCRIDISRVVNSKEVMLNASATLQNLKDGLLPLAKEYQRKLYSDNFISKVDSLS